MIANSEPRTVEDIIAELRQSQAVLIDDMRDVERLLGAKANYVGMAKDALREMKRCLTDARVNAELFDRAGAYRKLDAARHSLAKADGYIKMAAGEAVDDGG